MCFLRPIAIRKESIEPPSLKRCSSAWLPRVQYIASLPRKLFCAMFAPLNEIIYEEDFRKDIHNLPGKVQDKLGLLVEILRQNPFDPRLHTKHLGPPLQGAFSFRITRDYRVGFELSNPHTVKLLIADTRDNIYRRLLRKL